MNKLILKTGITIYACLSMVIVARTQPAVVLEKPVWHKEFPLESVPKITGITGERLSARFDIIPDDAGGIHLITSSERSNQIIANTIQNFKPNGIVRSTLRFKAYSNSNLTFNHYDNSSRLFLSVYKYEGSTGKRKTFVYNQAYFDQYKNIEDKSYVLPLRDQILVFNEETKEEDDYKYLCNLNYTDSMLQSHWKTNIELTSSLIDEIGISEGKSQFGFYVDNVVLKGPDHHDIALYMMDMQGKTIWHRNLTSQSRLGRLKTDCIKVLENGDLLVLGNADDAVNFGDEDKFIFPEGTSAQSPNNYSFMAIYNLDGKLKHLHFLSEGMLYNPAKYQLIKADEQTVWLGKNTEAVIYQFDLKNGKGTLIPYNVPLIENQQDGYDRFFYTSENAFFRIFCKYGSVDTNKPASVEVQYYQKTNRQ